MPHVQRAMQKAALVGEILADRNGNGVPDVMEVGRPVARPHPPQSSNPLPAPVMIVIAAGMVIFGVAALALSKLLMG